MTKLLILADWKSENYDLILVIINQFTKMIYYKLVKITINTSGFTKVIIDIVIKYHGLPDSIITDQNLLFKSKF